MSDLCDRDIVTWSDLVKRGRIGPGEHRDEIESAGHGDLHAVTSWLMAGATA